MSVFVLPLSDPQAARAIVAGKAISTVFLSLIPTELAQEFMAARTG